MDDKLLHGLDDITKPEVESIPMTADRFYKDTPKGRLRTAVCRECNRNVIYRETAMAYLIEVQCACGNTLTVSKGLEHKADGTVRSVRGFRVLPETRFKP